MIFALYGGGARDYVLIAVGDTNYISGQFAQGGIRYFTDYPVLLRAVWTLNIFGGLLAPILLLARSRWAVLAAVVAAAAQALLLAVTFTLLDRWASLGAATAWFDLGIGLVTAAFAGYCLWMRRRNLLR